MKKTKFDEAIENSKGISTNIEKLIARIDEIGQTGGASHE